MIYISSCAWQDQDHRIIKTHSTVVCCRRCTITTACCCMSRRRSPSTWPSGRATSARLCPSMPPARKPADSSAGTMQCLRPRASCLVVTSPCPSLQQRGHWMTWPCIGQPNVRMETQSIGVPRSGAWRYGVLDRSPGMYLFVLDWHRASGICPRLGEHASCMQLSTPVCSGTCASNCADFLRHDGAVPRDMRL
jgi:hypothetical protein